MLFVTSSMDQFVKAQDVEQMYKMCTAKNKQLQYIEKEHNASRDIETIVRAADFLGKSLENMSRKRSFLKVLIKNKPSLGGQAATLLMQL